MEELKALLEKYNNFKYEQIRSVTNIAENVKKVTLMVQNDDGEDVTRVDLEFEGITASRILENSVLSFLDMTSGVTLIKEHDLYGFALGSGTAMLHVHNAPLYIVASGVKITQEAV